MTFFGYTIFILLNGVIFILIHGSIISGEFDQSSNEFYIQQVKSLETDSILNKNQFNNLLQYLKSIEDHEDGQIITLYDQLPLLLSKGQISQLIHDLEKIELLYN